MGHVRSRLGAMRQRAVYDILGDTHAGLLLIAAKRPAVLLRRSIDLAYHYVGSLVDLGVVRSCLVLYTMMNVGSTKYR
jgi:hypothetical protein